jgi:hypothetical protein
MRGAERRKALAVLRTARTTIVARMAVGRRSPWPCDLGEV